MCDSTHAPLCPSPIKIHQNTEYVDPVIIFFFQNFNQKVNDRGEGVLKFGFGRDVPHRI